MKKVLLLFALLFLTGCGASRELNKVIKETDSSNIIKLTSKKEVKKEDDKTLLIVYDFEDLQKLRGDNSLTEKTVGYTVEIDSKDKDLTADELYEKYKPENIENKVFIISYNKAEVEDTTIKSKDDHRLYQLEDYDLEKTYDNQSKKIDKIIKMFTK